MLGWNVSRRCVRFTLQCFICRAAEFESVMVWCVFVNRLVRFRLLLWSAAPFYVHHTRQERFLGSGVGYVFYYQWIILHLIIGSDQCCGFWAPAWKRFSSEIKFLSKLGQWLQKRLWFCLCAVILLKTHPDDNGCVLFVQGFSQHTMFPNICTENSIKTSVTAARRIAPDEETLRGSSPRSSRVKSPTGYSEIGPSHLRTVNRIQGHRACRENSVTNKWSSWRWVTFCWMIP